MILWRSFLRVEEWTPMGAIVSDLLSSRTFHLSTSIIEEHGYIPFVHTSPEGKDSDLTLLIRPEVLGD